MEALLCALLSAILIRETGAIAPVYVLKGEDVRLDIQHKSESCDELKWMYESENILKYQPNLPVKMYPNFKEKVEFFTHNMSLLLKNLQETHSGTYVAKTDCDQEVKVAEYVIAIQEKVSRVVLKVESSSCHNMTVTCEAPNISPSVRHTCYNNTCTQVGVQSSKVMASTLSVYVDESLIICNHSNRVSWVKDTLKMVSGCQQTSESQITMWIIVGVIGSILLLLLVIGIVYYCKKRSLCTGVKKEKASTTYDSVHFQGTNQAGLQEGGNVMDVADGNMAAESLGPDVHSASEPRVTQEYPESLYSQVEKVKKK